MKTNVSPQPAAPGRCAGFTLAEALIATAVVGVSFISLYSGLAQGTKIVQASQQTVRATQILGEKMETIRLYTWDQVTNSSYIPTTFTNYYYPGGQNSGTAGVTYYGTLTIANTSLGESYNSDLRQVTVTVTWTSDSGQHQRQMTTMISHYGMQNYIYK